jgi:beta-glucosidase
MWTKPERNVYDAVVAAWLPGTQGDGVADVIVAGRGGKARRDFTGKLSFNWPKTAVSPVKSPLFPLGYGLNYRSRTTLGALSEAPGIDVAAALNVERYFALGRALSPWTMTVSDAGGARPVETGTTSSPSRVLIVRPVDLTAQDDARQFEWSGSGQGAVTISGPSADLARQFNNAFALAIDWRVDAPPAKRVVISFGDQGLDVSQIIRAVPATSISTTTIPLRCFPRADFSKIGSPLSLATDGVLRVTIAQVRLEPISSADTCPPSAQ